MEYSYSITNEILTNNKILVWKNCYYLKSNSQNGRNIAVYLDFNIKDNQPCLHFRYEGFRLGLNDRICLLDYTLTPIIDCEVVKRPYIYKDNIKGVDFSLLPEDLISLKKSAKDFRRIFIKHHNGDSPTEINVGEESKFSHLLSGLTASQLKALGLDAYMSSDTINYFKLYVNTYLQALKEANISAEEKHTPDYIKTLAEEMGMSADLLTKILHKDPLKEPSKVEFDYCYVYLMHDKRNGYHKIGISKEPKYREKTLQSEQPAIEMVCNKRYPSRRIAEAIESALHKAYAEQRVRGEWFDLSPEDVIMLKESLS